MKFIFKLKETLTGKNGALSYRRLTTFVFVCLSIYTVAFKIPADQMITAYFYQLVFILLLTGVITSDKLIDKYLENK